MKNGDEIIRELIAKVQHREELKIWLKIIATTRTICLPDIKMNMN